MRRKSWLILAAAVIFSIGSHGTAAHPAAAKARYVFLFIGDGMGVGQRQSADLYVSTARGAKEPRQGRLNMNTFPAQGMTKTLNLTGGIPDSASAATAIACGFKTKSGVIGMDPQGEIRYESIAEAAKRNGWKVGILTSVSLNHATPAAFYAHVLSRRQLHDIGMQLVRSEFDYFAGGRMKDPVTGKDPEKPNAVEAAREKGYKFFVGRAAFEGLRKGAGKVIAVNEKVDKDGAMVFVLDRRNRRDHVTLAEYTAKGIECLENPKGFFMMVEGGKIDWACHANDGATCIHETLALDDAVAEAVKFYKKHPEDTLIIVTADHETGGMTLGAAAVRDHSFAAKIRQQKMSCIEFGKKIEEYKKEHGAGSGKFEDVLPLIQDAFGLYVIAAAEKRPPEKALAAEKFGSASQEAKESDRTAERRLIRGLVLNEHELKILRDAFQQSMVGRKGRQAGDLPLRRYAGYEPLAVKLTMILNHKAGIGWTSYFHTDTPVPTSALGVGAEMFNGYSDQTEIHIKMMKISGLNR